MDLSRQEVDSGKGQPKVKDLAGAHDWEDTWDQYRAADILEKSVSNREIYSASSTDFSSPVSGTLKDYRVNLLPTGV